MSKNIENRRAFFKKVAQTALAVPFLAVAAKEVVAETQVGPSLTCENACTGGCLGNCYKSCADNCTGGCRNSCYKSCADNCTGTSK